MRLTIYKTKLTDEGKVVLVKETSVNNKAIDKRVTSPEKVNKIAREFLHIHEEAEEYAYLLCLNTKNIITSIFELSHGTVNTSIVGIRELFQKALLANAVSIVLIHNHPSGDCTPSQQDKDLTIRTKEAGDIIGVELIDHMIIGEKYFSFKEARII